MSPRFPWGDIFTDQLGRDILIDQQHLLIVSLTKAVVLAYCFMASWTLESKGGARARVRGSSRYRRAITFHAARDFDFSSDRSGANTAPRHRLCHTCGSGMDRRSLR